MQAVRDPLHLPLCEVSRSALDLAHRLLMKPAEVGGSLDALLAEVATVFRTPAAGLAQLPGGGLVACSRTPRESACWPGQQKLELLEPLRTSPASVLLPGSEGQALLVAGGANGWLLWLEDAATRTWSEADRAALVMIAQALTHVSRSDPTAPRWAQQLERARRQGALEVTAGLVRRMAHDFGNILTGIFGFAELSLGQCASESLLKQHVGEIHAAAQHGAQWINQLRVFTRRNPARAGSSSLALLLAEEEGRLRQQCGSTGVRLAVPHDLPAVALDLDSLRQALHCLLENAREALGGEGVVTVSARQVELTEADCADFYGNVAAGPAVEIAVSDTGCGLSPEVQCTLFTELFFSTKSRQRGMGLAMVYGLMQAFRGGLRLEPGPERGTVARLVLPLAAAVVPVVAAVPVPRRAPAPPGERVLVVDDDPMILNLVCSTLERAGYRVQPAASAVEALASYAAARAEPFRLVLSDVLMPQMTGVDLVRCLLTKDANVNVLFMSGHVTEDLAQQGLAGWRFDLLQKPFRTEGLLRAVRLALERGGQRLPAASPGL